MLMILEILFYPPLKNRFKVYPKPEARITKTAFELKEGHPEIRLSQNHEGSAVAQGSLLSYLFRG
jgi:hypothetical protein